MGLINRYTVVAAAGIGVATAAVAWDNDGIAGCFNKEGRAHFLFDDGTLSADPIRNLSMGDEVCTLSHGGGSNPDVYPRVDIEGSDYAQGLVEEAVDFSEARWQLEQPETTVHAYEMFIAFVGDDGYIIEDVLGEPATGILTSQFTDQVMPVSLGDANAPQLDENVLGSVVFAYKHNDGISYARVPAERAPALEQ